MTAKPWSASANRRPDSGPINRPRGRAVNRRAPTGPYGPLVPSGLPEGVAQAVVVVVVFAPVQTAVFRLATLA